jgi:hypothetical protein
MTKKSSKKIKSNKTPVFQKPVIPNFPGTKGSSNFHPTGRFQSINRSRR